MEISNLHHQTRQWENACIKTRRNLKRRKERIAKFRIKKSDKVLDLGCGDGLNSTILQDLGISNVIGVDISKPLLQHAQKNSPKTKFYVGSAEKIPFKDRTFSIVFVDSVFHHLLDYDKAITEIRRVLKINGYLCFIEPHRSLMRSALDFICTLPISKIIPILKERREAYFGEIHLMKHWLSTEDEFYRKLGKYKFRKVFLRSELLSNIGKFRKN